MTSHPVRVAIDLETTGLLVDQDSIIEIGAVKFAGPAVLDTFASFVASRQPLPYRVQRLTGIRPTDLAEAPVFADLAEPLRAFLGEAPLVGHSVQFDVAFLRRLGIGRRNPLVDTYELASALLPDLPSYTLEAVGAALGVASPVHHRALADAHLAREVLLSLLVRFDALDDATLRTLGRLTTGRDWTPAYFVRAALRARDAKGPVSSGLAASLGDQLTAKLEMDPAVLGLAIARADEPTSASASMAASAPLAVAPAMQAADDTSLGAARAPALAAATTLVATCVEQGGLALVEMDASAASVMACLGPFLRWRQDRGGRVTIAAADAAAAARVARVYVPAALQRLGLTAGAVTVTELGERSSYLCLHRWYGAATLPRDHALPRDVARGLSKLAVWSSTTRSGRRSDVTLAGQEQVAWARARAGDEFRDSFDGCAYRKHGYCFLARAASLAHTADVVVATHAALAEALTDQGPARLPLERVLVLDAHALEDALREVGAWTVDRTTLLAALGDLADTEPGGTRCGLLHLLAQRHRDAPEPTWFSQVARARTAAEAFFTVLGRLQSNAEPGDSERSKRGADTLDRALRLDAQTRQRSPWHEVEASWSTLRTSLLALATLLGHAVDRYPLANLTGRSVAADGLATDLLGIKRTIERQCANISMALGSEREETVYWLRQPLIAHGQRSATSAFSAVNPAQRAPAQPEPPVLCGARIEVGELLAPLVGPERALVLAGTALAAGGEFDYLCDTLGLPPGDVRTVRAAPERTDQTLLLVPDDGAEPNQQFYQRELDQALIAVGTALGGRVVAIFPSHAALRATYAGIKPVLEQQDVLVLAQGLDGSVRQLWQTYRSQPGVVLLGTGTFWDGADLDGLAPACVFVARLPLPSLSDPLLAARADAWQDPQQQFAVPYAALKLRQALSGLAWSHAQRNAVVLFDRRVLTRGYGATVLATLPRCAVRHEPLAHLAEHVASWVAAEVPRE